MPSGTINTDITCATPSWNIGIQQSRCAAAKNIAQRIAVTYVLFRALEINISLAHPACEMREVLLMLTAGSRAEHDRKIQQI